MKFFYVKFVFLFLISQLLLLNTTGCENSGASGDNTPDKLNLEISSSSDNPTDSSPIYVNFNFSRDVTNFEQGDISVTNGTIEDFSSIVASVYTVEIEPVTYGNITVSVSENSAFDDYGMGNPATELSINYYDSEAPDDVDLTITDASSSSISLSWAEPADPDFDHVLITWTPGGTSGFTVNKGITQTAISSSFTGYEYTVTVQAVDSEGNTSSGTSQIVHYIYYSSQLSDINNSINNYDDYYSLMTNITLSGSWSSIGNNTSRFIGTFDGNDYTISNLTIVQTTGERRGFFGIIGSGGIVRDLKLSNIYINCEFCVGALSGGNSGTISNCSVSSGTIQGQSRIGGLVGVNIGLIEDSYSSVTVIGATYQIGGLVGYNSTGEINNCYATGSVTGNVSVGGLAGKNYTSGESSTVTISNCYATGSVYGSDEVGGLVGSNYPYSGIAAITNCYATGSVTGEWYTGGLVGYNNATIGTAASIIDCYATGTVDGVSNTGGLVGYNDGLIRYTYAVGSVTGVVDTGGLVGNNTETVEYSFFDSSTTGQSSSDGGTARTTSSMNTISTYTSEGWDFSATWSRSTSINSGYPYLQDNAP